MPINRRQFIKSSSYASFASFVLGYALRANATSLLASSNFANSPSQAENENDNPIQNVELSKSSSLDFNGDNINRPHDILWNIDGYVAKKGGIPAPSVFTKIVVAGGGMSGLLSAYHLKHHAPILLEQDNVFGGNSKGENFDGSFYSIGAAYVTIPDEGSDVEKFFAETGIAEKLKHESDTDTSVNFKNKLMKNFWQGASDPENADQFIMVEKELRRICEEAYPDIPWVEDSAISFEELCALDAISFDEWLTKTFSVVHPHVREYFQAYCWSSFGGSIDELSAAQVLNFVTSEVDGVLALPGGNSYITQTLHTQLKSDLPQGHVLSEAFVLRVKIQDSGKVWVTFESKEGNLVTVECDQVICAFPKFVAERVVADIEAERIKAIDFIPYRGYIVTNVILDSAVKSAGYDIFCLNGKMQETPSPMKPPKKLMTDVVYGSWAQNDEVNYSVLTMYRPLPFDGARQFLFSPFSHQKHLIQSQNEITEFLKTVNISMDMVKGYRLTRWGHSLPLARKGLIADGTVAKLIAPIQNKIFFVNQDNWVNPAFECAFSESLTAAQLIESLRA
jgi:protoporphyrinogen oxidase